MSTGIEWTDETWNPTTGCTKVSPGCDHCYAETMHERFNGKGSFATVQLHPDRLDKPMSWKKPRKVFVNSMSDLFHKDVPDSFITSVFAVMALTPQHTYQILTKRHGRMRSLLSDPEFWDRFGREARHRGYGNDRAANFLGGGQNIYDTAEWEQRRHLDNVWLGVSVEDQKRADLRIPALLDTPAAVRFLSCEPLLGPVDLSAWLDTPPSCGCGVAPDGAPGATGCSAECMEPEPSGLGWCIVGGESGHGARPMHPQWARSLRDQCVAAGVPFLFKQHGEWAPEDVKATERGAANALYIEHDGSTRPAARGARGVAVTVQRNGKKATGRRLDGRTWDQYPDGGAA